MKWLFGIACLFAFNGYAGTIYLCKAYSGGTFWANTHCNQHSALIERIATVPDSLPFDQQVNLAEQQRSGATTERTTTVTNTTTTNNSGQQNRKAECLGLDSQITNYDSMARQPQTGQMQDWIAAQKKKARDRQFALKC